MLRVSFWAFWYIYCLLSKTGPDGCRETRGTRTREVACKPRQDFSIQKGSIFFLPYGWVWCLIKSKVGPFAPLKMGHVALLLEKEKKIIFFKKPNSLSSSRNFRKLFLFPRCFSSSFFSTIVVHLSSKLLFLSTPNWKEKPFSESWSTPLHCGTSNFRYG